VARSMYFFMEVTEQCGPLLHLECRCYWVSN
jgi:hypothetical protein